MAQPQDLTGRLRNIRQPEQQVRGLPKTLAMRPRAHDWFTTFVCLLCVVSGGLLLYGFAWLL